MKKSFITIIPDSGSNNGTLNVTAQKNTSEAKSTSFSVSGSGITKTVNVNIAKGIVNKVGIKFADINLPYSVMYDEAITHNGIYHYPEMKVNKSSIQTISNSILTITNLRSIEFPSNFDVKNIKIDTFAFRANNTNIKSWSLSSYNAVFSESNDGTIEIDTSQINSQIKTNWQAAMSIISSVEYIEIRLAGYISYREDCQFTLLIKMYNK